MADDVPTPTTKDVPTTANALRVRRHYAARTADGWRTLTIQTPAGIRDTIRRDIRSAVLAWMLTPKTPTDGVATPAPETPSTPEPEPVPQTAQAILTARLLNDDLWTKKGRQAAGWRDVRVLVPGEIRDDIRQIADNKITAWLIANAVIKQPAAADTAPASDITAPNKSA